MPAFTLRRTIIAVTIVNTLPEGCEPMCRGCRHRALEQGASLEQKHAYLSRVLAPWTDRLAPLQPLPEDARLGYRDKVTLNVRWSEHAGWRFGLMRRDELIEIHDCPVHSARVRRLVRLLCDTLPPPTGFALAYLHVSGAQATLIVKQRAVDTRVLERTLAALPGSGIEGLWVHCHPCAGRRLFARGGWSLAWGQAQSCDAGGTLARPHCVPAGTACAVQSCAGAGRGTPRAAQRRRHPRSLLRTRFEPAALDREWRRDAWR